MTERDPSTQQLGADWREQTTPGLTPVPQQSPVGPGAPRHAGPDGGHRTSPDYSNRPVGVRGPDSLGGLLLILAGIAAAVSLALRWTREGGQNGLDLVNRGFDELGSSFRDLVDTGFWQPLAVVLAGGVLLLLGLLLWLPARTHRSLGVLALFVSLLAIAAVLVPFAAEEWDPSAFRAGFWPACAVGVLGLLGALKAMLTGPRYR